MRTLAFIILTSSLLTSCVGVKKYTRFAEAKIEAIKTATISENITFDLSELENKNAKVTSTTLKSQFIPAILYWQWNNTIKCEINPRLVGEYFREDFLAFADTLNMYEKLEGRELEVKIEKIPTRFLYVNKGHTFILLYLYTVSSLTIIYPQKEDLVVSYKLTENGSIIKEGSLTVKNKDQAINNKFKSTKKFTWQYIDQFKENNRKLTNELVDMLFNEL
jgi:hypothetical protein